MTTTSKHEERSSLRALYASLAARRRPEDVAEMIREVIGDRLSKGEYSTLENAARYALKRYVFDYTSMAEEFARPVGMDRQVARARELFETAYPLTEDQCSNPEAVEALVRTISAEIGKAFGANDFMYDRLSHQERKARGIEFSRRGYNKRFRLLARMERRLVNLAREIQKREFQMVGKSGLASKLSWEEFSADVDTACFVAGDYCLAAP